MCIYDDLDIGVARSIRRFFVFIVFPFLSFPLMYVHSYVHLPFKCKIQFVQANLTFVYTIVTVLFGRNSRVTLHHPPPYMPCFHTILSRTNLRRNSQITKFPGGIHERLSVHDARLHPPLLLPPPSRCRLPLHQVHRRLLHPHLLHLRHPHAGQDRTGFAEEQNATLCSCLQ